MSLERELLPDEGRALAPLTTLEVGGPARFYVEVTSEHEAERALAFASDRRLPVLVLGGGSNLLVADRGFGGLVLRPRLLGISREDEGAATRVEAGAGEPWDAFVAWTVEAGLSGVECLSGIPGDLGGTPIQNVGAYGQEVADTLASVRVLPVEGGPAEELDASSLRFGYRTSRLKHDEAGRWLVTRVTFRLSRAAPLRPRYAELAARLGEGSPTAARVRSAVLELRRAKSMVHDRLDPNHRSAGSFFTNPVVTGERAAEARARLVATGRLGEADAMPTFPDPTGIKLSAGWLIERSGFPRGSGEGRVGLSTKHALALVNRGGATATELVAYATKVKRAVLEATGVRLAPEPVLAGFEPEETAELLA